MTTTITPATEKKLRYAIYGYPSCIIDAIHNKVKSGDNSWETSLVTDDPEYYLQSYEVRHNGKKVITIGRLHGFGFGAQASYNYYNDWQVEELRSLLGHDKVERSYDAEDMRKMQESLSSRITKQ